MSQPFLSIRIDILPKIGFGLCFYPLIIALNLYIFSLPVSHLGIWPQSELAISVLHFCAALNALGFLILWCAGENMWRFVTHPFVTVPFLIGLISLILTIFTDYPLRNILGSVRLGEGSAWWFDWAIFTAASLFVCRITRLKYILCAIALFSFAVTYALSISHSLFSTGIAPYYFPDFLAFQIICLAPLMSVLFKGVKITKPIILMWVIFYVFINVLMYPTSNMSGIAYTAIGSAFFIILWNIKSFPITIKQHLSTAAIAFVPILVLLLLFGLPFYLGDQGYYEPLGHGSAFFTFTTRAYLVKASLSDMSFSNPALITGFGWGSFNEVLTRNLPINWLDFTRTHSMQWDGITRDHFHSHNMFVEMLTASGVITTILFYIYILNLGLYAAHSLKLHAYIFSGGLVTLLSFWFLMPLNMPFIALTAAIISKPNTTFNLKPYKNSIPCAVIAFCIIIFVTSLSSGIIVFQTAKAAHKYIPHPLLLTEREPACNLDINDFGAGGTHLSKLLIDRASFISGLHTQSIDNQKDINIDEIQKHILQLNNLFCQSSVYAKQYKPNVRLRISRLIIRSEVLVILDGYLDQRTRNYYYENWENELHSWLTDYPLRFDQATPFLSWHLARADDAAIRRITSLLLDMDRNNPVGLWFMGFTMLNDPNYAQHGLSLMRLALDKGIERYIPIDNDLRQQLNNEN